MDRLKTLLDSITVFDPETRAFLLERAASMDPKTLEEFTASLGSYVEERDQLNTEYREHRRLLDEELRGEVHRMTGAVADMTRSLTKFSQSFEVDPEDLLA